MSYQVIARKWRPQSFEQLVGQDHIAQTLINALRSGRLPHALLFTGPRGTGKTSSARILAKSLRCPNAKDFVPCNECSECNDISQGRSLDVVEIDGASNNGVDAIRELRETVGYMPSSGKNKVYIVDEVHMLSTSAFNALLKTLEEPPSHVTFVLATTELQKIPNTILSRCQRFDFRTIATRKIAEHLKQICDKDGVQAEMEALWTLARQAGGSMRDSQSLLDQVITFCQGEVSLDAVVSVLGLTDRSLLTKTLQSLVDRDEQGVIEIAQSIFKSGLDPKVFVQELLEEIRNLLYVKVGEKGAELVDLPDSEIDFLRTVSEKLGDHDIHLLFDMTLKGSTDIHRSQDSRIVLEMLLLRMVNAPRIVPLAQIQAGFSGQGQALKKKVETRTQPAQQASVNTHQPTPSAEAKPSVQKASEHDQGSGATQEITEPSSTAKSHSPIEPQNSSPQTAPAAKGPWVEFVDKVKGANGLLGAMLENTSLLEKKDGIVYLVIPKKMAFFSEKIKEPDNLKRIKTFLKTFWNEDLDVEISLSDGNEGSVQTPKQKKEELIQKKKVSDKEQVESHPLIQSAQKQFKSQIVSIKEKP